ncbi:hypothetical protein D3C71_1402940 [compost metagenome]
MQQPAQAVHAVPDADAGGATNEGHAQHRLDQLGHRFAAVEPLEAAHRVHALEIGHQRLVGKAQPAHQHRGDEAGEQAHQDHRADRQHQPQDQPAGMAEQRLRGVEQGRIGAERRLHPLARAVSDGAGQGRQRDHGSREHGSRGEFFRARDVALFPRVTQAFFGGEFGFFPGLFVLGHGTARIRRSSGWCKNCSGVGCRGI